MEMQPFSARRAGKLPLRQLVPDTRTRSSRDDSVRDEPRTRTADTTVKAVRRKPEKPQ
jgi:hypothetical protein